MTCRDSAGGQHGLPARTTLSTVERSSRCHYLVGPSGYPNFGDELIAATWLRHLARTEPDAEVWLDCHSPGPAQLLLGDLHPRLRCVDTLWSLCGEAPSDDPWEVAAWVQEVVHDPGRAPRRDAGIALLGRADVVHLIGGGYLNALWPRHIGLIAGAAAAARRSGGRAAMTGQGFMPCPSGATHLLRSLADRFDVVDVRDDPSAELLAGSAAAYRTCDDAFLDLPEPPAHSRAREFVLCVQSDIGDLEVSTLAARVLGMLRAWRAEPGQIAVVEGIPRVDRAVHVLLEHELDGAEFHPFRDVWRHGVPVAPGQTWISTRYHLHLVAAAAGATGVALSVSPDYYATKHRSLADLGSGWTPLDALSTEIPERPDGNGFPASVMRRCRQLKLSVAEAIYGTPPNAPAVPTEEPATRRRVLRPRWSRASG
ncbi:polysaccharide pyruvyl transferase family protein [Amycolatopsis sp. NPDC058986]|uniref:polysaccharide pyruvyl transferase family protein n=1 Tax=unclassified Amycolatopsis TaxID=2618356 RepID=UPI00366E2397